MEKKDYLTVEEAAEFLGVSKRTVYQYLHEGRLIKSKPAGILYIPYASLVEFICSGIKKTPDSVE